jgi:hypothetical protein
LSNRFHPITTPSTIFTPQIYAENLLHNLY